MKAKESFEVIIPERSFIVNSLEEAREILDKYNVRGITIRRIKEVEGETLQGAKMQNRTKEELIEFSKEIEGLWNDAKIYAPIHLSGGNEEQLIDIFKEIKPRDYIFSTWRSHYHYLLAGGSKEKLRQMILNGDSMHINDKELNFITSSIVAGTACIATGVALALKLKNDNRHVWCFIGDGAEDEGHTYEAIRYVDGHDLPCTFVIEDNNRAVETPKKERYGKSNMIWPKCVRRYYYVPTYPHLDNGKWIDFSGKKVGGLL